MLKLKNIIKVYRGKSTPFNALKGIDLEINKGEFVTIIGSSGAGKSTLLQIVGLLEGFEKGSYYLKGKDISNLKSKELARIRLTRMGFVFQSFYLLNYLTAVENVELPLGYMGVPFAERRKKATEILEKIGLENKLDNHPGELSGGEQQRVAMARALANSPELILADEPTGNLDSVTSQKIMDLLYSLNREGITVIMVTHDQDLIKQATRVVKIQDGRIVS